MKKSLLVACGLMLYLGMLGNSAMAQGNIGWEELWRNVPPPPNQTGHPNHWMIPNRSYTGLAYDKWEDVLYIVNPHTTVSGPIFWQTPRIRAWNAMTGTPAMHMGRSADAVDQGKGGEIPVPIDTITRGGTLFYGYSQNTYSLYKIDLDDEGRIFACNLVVPVWGICILLPSGICDPVFLGQGPFRVWRWDTPKSTPILSYATLNASATAIGNINSSEQTWTRWGDAFDVIGERSIYTPPNGDPPYMYDSIRIHTSGGSWPNMAEWNREVNIILADSRPLNQRPNSDSHNGKLTYRLAVRLVNSISGLASHGVAATNNQAVQDVWMDSNLRVTTASLAVQDATDPWPQTYNQTSTGNRSLSLTLTNPSGPIKYFELREYGRKFIVVADGFPTGGTNPAIPNNNTTARILDVTTPGADFMLPFGATPVIGNKTLTNNSAVGNYIADVDFKLQYYTPQEDPDAPGLHAILFVLMSNNGIAAYRSRLAFPVELTTLRATLNGNMVDLSWGVTSETNNFGFEIERSFDAGSNWEIAGFVKGRGTSYEPFEYSFSDPVTETHKRVGSVKYRLRQVDHDGTYVYSPVVDLFFGATPSTISLYQNYPNPFNPSTTISYQLTQPGQVTLQVFNTLGEHVGTLVDGLKEAGAHQTVMNASDLPSGTYIYRLTVDGVMTQKKMTVMK